MAHLHARGLGATRETAMGEPYAPAPLIRLLGCMELTVHLATYSGHDATSKLQTLTSQCHYALTFHEECRASMHAHDDWHIFEADRAYLADHEPLAYHDHDWHDRAGIHGYFSWDNDHNSWQGGWLDDAGNGFFSDTDDDAATSSSSSLTW